MFNFAGLDRVGVCLADRSTQLTGRKKSMIFQDLPYLRSRAYLALDSSPFCVATLDGAALCPSVR